MDLSTWSSRSTRITHCLSHHQYPNLQQDWEAYSVEENLPFLPTANLEAPAVIKMAWPLGLFAFGTLQALQKVGAWDGMMVP